MTLTIEVDLPADRVVGPLAIRPATPLPDPVTAIEDAKYSQWPLRRTKRKYASGSETGSLSNCSV